MVDVCPIDTSVLSGEKAYVSPASKVVRKRGGMPARQILDNNE
jgi:hypothetical protein